MSETHTRPATPDDLKSHKIDGNPSDFIVMMIIGPSFQINWENKLAEAEENLSGTMAKLKKIGS